MEKNFMAKAVFNGFLAWLISFILNIVIALGYALWMLRGIDLEKAKQEEISLKISTEIGSLYNNSLAVIIISVVLTALVIFWRSSRAAKDPGQNGILAGVIVAGITVLLSGYFLFEGGFGIRELLTTAFYFAAGIAGGIFAQRHAGEQLSHA